MKIAIDYDGTLSTQAGICLVKDFLEVGLDVWIVTSRAHDMFLPVLDGGFLEREGWQLDNSAVWATAKELGIPPNKVFFTNSE